MYDITLYNYNGEPRTVNKILTDGVTISGRADISNITNPVVEMRVADGVTFNYVHIPALNRYYYIESTRVCGAGVVEITCKVDVLKTYSDRIINARGTVVNDENKNPYISVHNNIYDTRPKIEKLTFPNNVFNADGNIIMVTLKGNI